MYNIQIVDQYKIKDGFKPDRVQIRRVVRHVLKSCGQSSGAVSIAMVDDDAIRRLKQEYFAMDVATDVISFDLRDEDTLPVDCEVVVNAQLAVRLAGARGALPMAELALYIVHGLLHQLGYDDRHAPDARRMHQREDELLSELGFGRVYDGGQR